MDGIILLNKEKGYTSHDMVYQAKKILKEKVGHTGTLDPNATGVLPLLIGKGTLISKYLINHDKQYEAVLKLGITTDTADEEGNILEERKVEKDIWKQGFIENVLQGFIGKQKQTPPMYAAIKVNGKKLYEYARKGEKVEIKPRDIEIYNLGLIEKCEEKNEIRFIVSCSKGTYIRTLCEDIAEKLGTIGYMKELKRTKVGEFDLKESITIKELEEKMKNNKIETPYFISIEEMFKEKEEIVLNNKKLELFLNGVKLNMPLKDSMYRIYNEAKIFIGLGILEKEKLKRDVII